MFIYYDIVNNINNKEATLHSTGGVEAAASATAEIDREIANCTLDLGNQVRRVVKRETRTIFVRGSGKESSLDWGMLLLFASYWSLLNFRMSIVAFPLGLTTFYHF